MTTAAQPTSPALLQSLLTPIVGPYRRLRRTVGRHHILDNLPPHLHDLAVKLADSINGILPTDSSVPKVGPDDVCTVLGLVQILPLLYLTLSRTRHIHRIVEVVFTLLQPTVVSYGIIESESKSSGGGGRTTAGSRAKVLPMWVAMAALWILERSFGVRPCHTTVYLLIKCIACAVVFEPTGSGLDWSHNLLTVLGVTAKAHGTATTASPAGSECSSSDFSFVDVGASSPAVSTTSSTGTAGGAEERAVVLTIEEMAGVDWSAQALNAPYIEFHVVAPSAAGMEPPGRGGRTMGTKLRTDVGIAVDGAAADDDVGEGAEVPPDLSKEAGEGFNGKLEEDEEDEERTAKEEKIEITSSYAWPGQVLSIPVSLPSSSSSAAEGSSSSAPVPVLRVAAYDRRTIGNDVPVGIACLPLTADLLTAELGSRHSLVLRRDGRRVSGEETGTDSPPEVGTVKLFIRSC